MTAEGTRHPLGIPGACALRSRPGIRLARGWPDEVDLGRERPLRYERRRPGRLRGPSLHHRRGRVCRFGEADDGGCRGTARGEPLTALLAEDQVVGVIPAAGDANHVTGWDNGMQVTVKVPTQIRRSRLVRSRWPPLELPSGLPRTGNADSRGYGVSCASRASARLMKWTTPAP